jgi:hypothetical protein
MSEHFNEVLLVLLVYGVGLLPAAERVGASAPELVPWNFFTSALVVCLALGWLGVVRVRRVDAEVVDGCLRATNFWRYHEVELRDLVTVRCSRGRSSVPLVEVVAADGQAVVIESAEFRSLDLIGDVLGALAGRPIEVEWGSDDLLFPVMGYGSESLTAQARHLVRSVRDGSWVRRQLRVY